MKRGLDEVICFQQRDRICGLADDGLSDSLTIIGQATNNGRENIGGGTIFSTQKHRDWELHREKMYVLADNGYTAAHRRHFGGYFDHVIVGANGLINALVFAIPGFGVAG